jgi:hypothetical protein
LGGYQYVLIRDPVDYWDPNVQEKITNMTKKLIAEKNCVAANTISSFSDEFLDFVNETNLDITTKGILLIYLKKF